MKRVLIFVDGSLVGYTTTPNKLIQSLREKRRKGEFSSDLNVFYYKNRGYILINTEGGRVRRPLIVVENGKSKLTPELIEKYKKSEIGWDDLVRMGVIEYLDPDEEEEAYVAVNEEELTEEHTHLEINDNLVNGVIVAQLPYQNHNSSPRTHMAASMSKQAIGFRNTNILNRFDSHNHLLYYPQEPIVKTPFYDSLKFYMKPAGQNFVVAVMSYEGYNMDDAVILNKSSIERGLGRSVFYRVEELEKRRYAGGQVDRIEIPSPSVEGYRGEDAYKKLDEDGIARVEEYVEGGDVIIGRTAPPRFLEEPTSLIMGEKRKEASLDVREGEKGYVDSVLITTGQNGNPLIRVKIRSDKIIELGDKFASRHGQKGVVGLIVNQEDMPYTNSGITPDLIMNPLAIPSRTTAGHIIEMITGKAGSLRGSYVDGSSFDGEDIDSLRKVLESYGFNSYGKEILRNGITGEKFEVEIFMGVIYYQKLHHMAFDKLIVRSRGPVQLLTHQPTEGKARKGGLRVEEMARDAYIAYGAPSIIKDRLLEQSDEIELYVCEKCGSLAYYNYIKRDYECNACGSNEVRKIKTSSAFKLLVDEMMSLGVDIKFKLSEE